MKKVLWLLIPFILLGAYLYKPEARTPVSELALSVIPENPIQGEPVLIMVNGTTSVESIKFNGRELRIFEHEGKPSALAGIDLRAETGEYDVEVSTVQSRTLHKKLAVGERVIAKVPLGIPEKLGGDTPEAEQELINTLVKEAVIINAVPSGDKKLWSSKFRFPLEGEIFVTDSYGYSRITLGSTISHKGADFRAEVGTPVYAMNKGFVAYTGFLRNYGHTIIIDHGLGLHTVYMHLSKVEVEEGKRANKGDLIGYSGDTGYVLGPHLHISVRINHISIDPMKFMEILGE